jgi:hypothetical protein
LALPELRLHLLRFLQQRHHHLREYRDQERLPLAALPDPVFLQLPGQQVREKQDLPAQG